jgi:hypothetical protein
MHRCISVTSPRPAESHNAFDTSAGAVLAIAGAAQALRESRQGAGGGGGVGERTAAHGIAAPDAPKPQMPTANRRRQPCDEDACNQYAEKRSDVEITRGFPLFDTFSRVTALRVTSRIAWNT